jgi:hypothetical protein
MIGVVRGVGILDDMDRVVCKSEKGRVRFL